MQHEVGLRPFLVIMALLLGAALAGIGGVFDGDDVGRRQSERLKPWR